MGGQWIVFIELLDIEVGPQLLHYIHALLLLIHAYDIMMRLDEKLGEILMMLNQLTRGNHLFKIPKL